jgi:hypothetical protein
MSESGLIGLEKLLAENVVELIFRRRHQKLGHPPHRRMFCTNSRLLLNDIVGKSTLKFKPPKGIGLPYIPIRKGLVVTWDIFMQKYRQIPLESVDVLATWPVRNKEEVAEFWKFFMEVVHPMSASQKRRFMDR